MSKLNHFVCPHCSHDWYEGCAYGTCDACGCFFYLSSLPAMKRFCEQRVRCFINGVPAEQWLQQQNSVCWPTHWTDVEAR